MSKIHFNKTTTLSPEQFVAGLTAGTSEGLQQQERRRLPRRPRPRRRRGRCTEGPGGVWERLRYDWSDPDHVVLTTTDSNVWGGASGYTYTLKRLPDGMTDVDIVIVREGKNAKGRVLGLVLGTVGKGVLG